LSDRGEGDVTVPSGVAAAFEVVEPESVFEFAVVVLDSPADLREAYQTCSIGSSAKWRMARR